MSLVIDDKKGKKVEKFEVTERLYIDTDGNIVPEDSPEAAFLYATPGKRVPLDEAVEKSLITKAAAKKQADKPADKQKTPAQNKRRKAAAKKQADKPADKQKTPAQNKRRKAAAKKQD